MVNGTENIIQEALANVTKKNINKQKSCTRVVQTEKNTERIKKKRPGQIG